MKRLWLPHRHEKWCPLRFMSKADWLVVEARWEEIESHRRYFANTHPPPLPPFELCPTLVFTFHSNPTHLPIPRRYHYPLCDMELVHDEERQCLCKENSTFSYKGNWAEFVRASADVEYIGIQEDRGDRNGLLYLFEDNRKSLSRKGTLFLTEHGYLPMGVESI